MEQAKREELKGEIPESRTFIMRIRRLRGVSNVQILVVSFIGVLGGVYVWKPLIENYRKESNPKG